MRGSSGGRLRKWGVVCVVVLAGWFGEIREVGGLNEGNAFVWQEPSVSAPHPASRRALSCAFSVAMDTNRGCVNYCAAACDMSETEEKAWAASEEEMNDCLEDLRVACAVPVGYHFKWQPRKTMTRRHAFDWKSPSALWPKTDRDNIYFYDTVNIRYSTVQRVLTFDRSSWSQVVDPYRLTFAAIKKTGRSFLNNTNACHYVQRVYAVPASEFPTREEQRYRSKLNIGGPEFRRAHSSGLSLGWQRFSPYEDDVWKIDASPDQEAALLPNIASLIQQWWLRQEEEGGGPEADDFAISLTTHEDADNVQVKSPDLDDNMLASSAKASDPSNDAQSPTQIELHTFTGFAYDVPVPDECARHTSCKTCTMFAACHWCDLSDAKIDAWSSWAGFESHFKTVTSTGSGCGIPPLVCTLMGGDTYRDKCRAPRWIWD